MAPPGRTFSSTKLANSPLLRAGAQISNRKIVFEELVIVISLIQYAKVQEHLSAASSTNNQTARVIN